MKARLYWRFVGAPKDRPGGPWWYRDCSSKDNALNQPGVFMRGIIAEARLLVGDLPTHGNMDIYPPDNAVVVWDGVQRINQEHADG